MNIIIKICLVTAVILSIFARAYDYKERFAFDHDSDLSAWIVKDILVDRHPRLIGQLTSAPGVFIGSLFYYTLIPFFISAGMDPLGTVSYSWFVGIIGVLSIFYVVSKIHNSKAGLISAFFYAVSFGISVTERQVVPTMWIFVWSIWFYYAISKLFTGDKKSLIIHAILFSLVWHIQFNLAILALLVIIGFVIKIKHFSLKEIVLPVFIFIFLSLPLIGFEFRHNFSQIKSIFGSVKTTEAVKRTPIDKLSHVLEYVARNTNYIFIDRNVNIPQYVFPGLIALATTALMIKRRIKISTYFIIISWFAIFITFFIVHPINLSEYYLNALNILWLIMAAVFLSYLPIFIPILVLFIFTLSQISSITKYTTSKNGYIEKTQLIEFIKSDSQSLEYPCVSISYITNIGYNLGYRYLIWFKGLKTAPISDSVPVYSVVFPLSLVDKFDKSFNSLGLVLPHYEKYTKSSVATGCSGPDYNTQDSMFGFTK